MIKLFVSFVLAVICQPAFSQDKAVAALKKLNSEWLASYPAKDTATLAKIFADDFVLISPKGVRMTKQDIISNIQKQETVSITVDSIDVRLPAKDVGILTAYTTFVLQVDGKEVIGQNCYQDVYVKRNGKWVAVAAHVTLLNMK